MSLLAEIKKIFAGADLPDDAREIIAGAQSPEKLIRDFEDRKTRLIEDLKELEDQALLVEQKIKQEKAAFAATDSRGEQDIVLRRLRRLEMDREGLRARIAGVDNNINLNAAVINRVLRLDALRTEQITTQFLDDLGMQVKDAEDDAKRLSLALDDLAAVGNRTADQHETQLDEMRKQLMEEASRAKNSQTRRARDFETE